MSIDRSYDLVGVDCIVYHLLFLFQLFLQIGEKVLDISLISCYKSISRAKYQEQRKDFQVSTQLKGVTGKTGEVNMLRFWGGSEEGVSVQLTFKKPEEERNRPDFGYWYLQMNKKQALELAAALIEFANDTREEVYD